MGTRLRPARGECAAHHTAQQYSRQHCHARMVLFHLSVCLLAPHRGGASACGARQLIPHANLRPLVICAVGTRVAFRSHRLCAPLNGLPSALGRRPPIPTRPTAGSLPRATRPGCQASHSACPTRTIRLLVRTLSEGARMPRQARARRAAMRLPWTRRRTVAWMAPGLRWKQTSTMGRARRLQVRCATHGRLPAGLPAHSNVPTIAMPPELPIAWLAI